MPSTTLEATGLVGLEAQACACPSSTQPVPGLREGLGTTAVATDFTQPAAVARELHRLRTDPGLLPAVREAGYVNAARHPLSATARLLHHLGQRLTN
ncbi:hypothetical protein BIV25_10720 [Streptomyces sp. MUSC 14]|nr:hypothetical protein BIV25_10720 [Streptomyces sp. MUSC 14]